MLKLDEVFYMSLKEIESNNHYTLTTTHLLRYAQEDTTNQVIYKKEEKVSPTLYSLSEHSSFHDNDKNIKIGKEAILDALSYIIDFIKTEDYRPTRKDSFTMDYSDITGKLIHRVSLRLSKLKQVKLQIHSYMDIHSVIDIHGSLDMFNKIVGNRKLLQLLKMIKSQP